MLIRIVGGLGNQMFIYAFAKAMEQRGYPILLDAIWYNHTSNVAQYSESTNPLMMGGGGANPTQNNTKQNELEQSKSKTNIRLFELESFNLSLTPCKNAKTIKKFILKHDASFVPRYIYKRLRYGILKGDFAYRPDMYALFRGIVCENDQGIKVNEVLKLFLNNTFKSNAHPWGYFQNLAYFKDIDSILRKEFTLKSPLNKANLALKAHIDSEKSSVFLHVRLGDYLYHHAYVQLGAAYYNRALDIIRHKVQNPHIFIFSNNIQWCENNLKDYLDFSGCEVSFVKGNDEGNAAQEMELMRSCKHAIIANSTFSWWAAYLIDNPNKVVIMPQYFFHDPKHLPRGELLCDEGWIMLNHTWGEIING